MMRWTGGGCAWWIHGKWKIWFVSPGSQWNRIKLIGVRIMGWIVGINYKSHSGACEKQWSVICTEDLACILHKYMWKGIDQWPSWADHAAPAATLARVSTTPGNTGNTGNLLEFEIPPGNTRNLLEFCWCSWKKFITSRFSGPKVGILGCKMGEGVVQCWTPTNLFLLLGVLRLCQFLCI